ncbi:MAG: AAA family ATPase [Deltaproteobacteria bacterium]|nr:AAA family ATPase [Deltaproteobacteria bacterium]
MKQIWREFEAYREKIEQQREQIGRRIIGLPKFIESLFICFYSHSERKLGPHLLVEGKVGRGKTATLETFTRTVAGARFSRIQFTPDLKPLDLIRIVEQREDRTLEFHPGPLFANLILADEINRAHEKTRAALLEAMGEKQITLGQTTYPLQEPFFVMATENPIDIEGTFMLGAAQLDRFMMKIHTESLSEEEELVIAETHQEKDPEIKQVITLVEVLEIQEFIRKNIVVDPEIRRDAIRIIRALRPEGGIVAPEDFYLLPEGERGYLFLERAAKVRAFLEGRDHVTFSDIAVLAVPVLNHRIGFQYVPKDVEKLLKAREVISRAVEKVLEDGARGF